MSRAVLIGGLEPLRLGSSAIVSIKNVRRTRCETWDSTFSIGVESVRSQPALSLVSHG